MKSMRPIRSLLATLWILILLVQPGVAENSEIGKLRAGRETLVLSLSEDQPPSVTLSFRKAKISTELNLADWETFRSLVQKAQRQASRLKPDDAGYTGQVGDMHVGVTYDQSGRYQGRRILIYMVLEDLKRSGLDLAAGKWDSLERLLDKAEEALRPQSQLP